MPDTPANSYSFLPKLEAWEKAHGKWTAGARGEPDRRGSFSRRGARGMETSLDRRNQCRGIESAGADGIGNGRDCRVARTQPDDHGHRHGGGPALDHGSQRIAGHGASRSPDSGRHRRGRYGTGGPGRLGGTGRVAGAGGATRPGRNPTRTHAAHGRASRRLADGAGHRARATRRGGGADGAYPGHHRPQDHSRAVSCTHRHLGRARGAVPK